MQFISLRVILEIFILDNNYFWTKFSIWILFNLDKNLKHNTHIVFIIKIKSLINFIFVIFMPRRFRRGDVSRNYTLTSNAEYFIRVPSFLIERAHSLVPGINNDQQC